MNLPDVAVCLVRPCGKLTNRARARRRGEVEWICDDHWAQIPKPIRRAYLQARSTGAHQLGDALWQWAACRHAAVTAAAPIVQPREVCEDGTPRSVGRVPEVP